MCYFIVLIKFFKENFLINNHFAKVNHYLNFQLSIMKYVNKMQEQFGTQKNTSIYQQIIPLEAQKGKLKCPFKNQAFSICVESKCQIAGLMCREPTCKCINNHYKCNNTQLDKVLNSIDKHQKQVPQQFQKSYAVTHQFINEMIDQLSQIRRKLQFEERYFGLTLQQMSFVALIEEQKIDKICGKLVNQLKKAFGIEINFMIQSHQYIQNDFKSKRSDFNLLLKHIEQNYTKFEVNGLLDDSKIVHWNNPRRLMNNWLSQASNRNVFSSKLLFRASEHNFSAAEFHKHCDGVENTLVIVKTEFDKIIGGFTPNKWHSEKEQFINDESEKSFLFSLTLEEKYKCINPKYSIYCSKDYGPIFGNWSRDLILGDQAHNGNNTFADFPNTYNLQVKGVNKYKRNQETYTLFTGAADGCRFRAKQYQVYQIKGM